MERHYHNKIDSPGIKVDGIVTGSTAVKTYGDEDVADVKTFNDSPIVPTATADDEMVRKDYVDANASLGQINASDDLVDSADTAEDANTLSPIKKKEIRINESDGTIRVKFDLRQENSFSDGSLAQIYVNGSAVGAERSTGSDVYDTFT